MSLAWPTASYDRRGATYDTLHAHTQVLAAAGKLEDSYTGSALDAILDR
jgi:hypothetical protein